MYILNLILLLYPCSFVTVITIFIIVISIVMWNLNFFRIQLRCWWCMWVQTLTFIVSTIIVISNDCTTITLLIFVLPCTFYCLHRSLQCWCSATLQLELTLWQILIGLVYSPLGKILILFCCSWYCFVILVFILLMRLSLFILCVLLLL